MSALSLDERSFREVILLQQRSQANAQRPPQANNGLVLLGSAAIPPGRTRQTRLGGGGAS